MLLHFTHEALGCANSVIIAAQVGHLYFYCIIYSRELARWELDVQHGAGYLYNSSCCGHLLSS